ncbi:hypothetical protein GCM10010252_04040 [Streptomyces aureoverticillatus]|nr:hypothetical protein GCM10010252_04040 [Streptomyces aureoverticillatus]
MCPRRVGVLGEWPQARRPQGAEGPAGSGTGEDPAGTGGPAGRAAAQGAHALAGPDGIEEALTRWRGRTELRSRSRPWHARTESRSRPELDGAAGARRYRNAA